ncbi:MAG TPA: glycosyltransferase family 9 protein [Candidatus Sulfopaludibacter sp.]|nr:glycosyltransferase family 9 protein [Candidatus Sulfopaludibacter sp.]
MISRPEKILALQFKYFGDAVLMTAALRALRGNFPNSELHLLVPEEVAPLFQHLPYFGRVWAMPRRRGRARPSQTWPVIRALRREHFDRSVDFASNDRGAIISRFIGARRRLGWDEHGGFWGRKFCYTDRVPQAAGPMHESARLAQLLSGWQIPPPPSLEPEIRSDPALADAAKKILPAKAAVICHVASSQPKKEWPLTHWARLHHLAVAIGFQLVFTTALGQREQALMAELKKLAPDAAILPAIPDLPLFLAVLARAGVFISGDTGPLHFAAGLGVPTISLFGPSSPAQWAPIGARHQIITGSPCACDGNLSVCGYAHHCLAAISPEQLLASLQTISASRRQPEARLDWDNR